MSESAGEKMKHLDEMTCLLYAERQLDRARALEVSAHTQECEACRTLLRALERESRLLTRAMLEEDEPLPSRLAQFQESARRSMQWIWGLVFGMAATGAYALYTQFIQPWQLELEKAGFGGTSLLNLLIFQGAFWKGWQSMLTVLEVAALMTLGALAVMFLRRRIRRGSALALVFAGLCGALLLPTAASATEFRKGSIVEIGKEEKIKGDLYITGERARVDGTVDGDVIVFGQTVDVNGHVTGDVIAFAQSVRISGQVDGNVRSFNNNITITGSVAKNAMIFGQTITVDGNGKVGGSLTSFSETLSVDGTVGRDLLLFFAHGNLGGKLGGGVRAKGDSLVITSTAVIEGPVHFEGHKQAEVSPSAKLASPVEFKQLQHKSEYRTSNYYVWRIIWTAAFILFGMVLFLLLPKFSTETIEAGEQVGIPIFLGILVFFGVPIGAIIACFTVVGIPIGVLTVGLWLLMLCTAELVVGAVVGNWILGKGKSNWETIGRMALGFVIVRIVYTPLSQMHVVGVLAALCIWMWGMGAISLAVYRRFQPIIAPGVPSAPMAPPMPPNTTVGGTLPA
jgi:cytoskeletal protein CcmA (bactofilin family)